ncbi:hypothetical protein VTI74DRAFT_3762 [Chaetomium olivicolor]
MAAPRELAPTDPFPETRHSPLEIASDRPHTPVRESPTLLTGGTPSPRSHGCYPGAQETAPVLSIGQVSSSQSSSPAALTPPTSSPLEAARIEALRIFPAASLSTNPQHLQYSSNTASPQPSFSRDGDYPEVQRLLGYCQEQDDLVFIDGAEGMNNISSGPNGLRKIGSSSINIMDPDNCLSLSPSPGARDSAPDQENGAGAGNMSVSSTTSERQDRHGQIGPFKHFPRFDQTSRPIVSDNWRAKATGDSSMTQSDAAGNMVSNSNRISPVTSDNDRSSSQTPFLQNYPQNLRSPFMCTPTRSPLPAPSNPHIAGFNQNPTHPPTPVSLSTPISMASPNRSQCHAPRSAAGSIPMSMNGYSPASANPTMSPATSTDLLATHMANLGIRNGNLPVTMNNALISNSGQTTTFPVTLPADALAYCFVRPNGTVTRLVPVDMLPFQLQGIRAQEGASERLVVLPVPGGVGADGRSSNTQQLRASTMPTGNGGGDVIQNTSTQPKRMKVYCDKWVHEGVCAFTQQGCKYKHEMPSDRATQHQLGLFLGYPAWWKKRQAELARGQSDPSCPAAATSCQQQQRQQQQQQGLEKGRKVPEQVVKFGQGQSGLKPRVGGGGGGGGGGFGEGRQQQQQQRFAGIGTGLGPELGPGSVVVGADSRVETARGASLLRQHPGNGSLGGGLAASRWGNNAFINTATSFTANENGNSTQLRPSWRPGPPSDTGSDGSQYEQQGYDGAGSGPGYETAAITYRTVVQPEYVLGGVTPNGAAGRFGGGAGNASWPWEQQQYVGRASETGGDRGKERSGYGMSGFVGACAFAFHPTPRSPYGPIAPPLRHPRQNGNDKMLNQTGSGCGDLTQDMANSNPYAVLNAD